MGAEFKLGIEGEIDFVDINKSLSWLSKSLTLGPVLDPDSSPWKNTCPTLVGSGKIVLRYCDPLRVVAGGGLAGYQVRALESFEYMRLIGWGDEEWVTQDGDAGWRRRITDSEDEHDFSELLANLAGNAYSVFHFGPLQMALLATYGKFCLGQETAESGSGDDDKSGSGDAASSDCDDSEEESD